MQDIMDTIIRNRNLLHKQYTEVENELDYLYLEGDEDAILEELDLLASELIKTSFVNCTPHHLTIEGIDELPPSGILPRVSVGYLDCEPLNGVRVRQKSLGVEAVAGLPDPEDGLSFIVSGMVRDTLSVYAAHLQRDDVFAPDTGAEAIRNDLGESSRCVGWFNNQPSPSLSLHIICIYIYKNITVCLGGHQFHCHLLRWPPFFNLKGKSIYV